MLSNLRRWLHYYFLVRGFNFLCLIEFGTADMVASTCSRESNGSPPQATAVRAIHPSSPCVALQIRQNHIWRVSVTSIQDKKSQKRTLTSKNLKPFKAADRQENKLYDCEGGRNVKAVLRQCQGSVSRCTPGRDNANASNKDSQ